MTHDTPPKRIWATINGAGNRAEQGEAPVPYTLGGWMSLPGGPRSREYALATEADAMVAAALREAARTGDRFIIPSLTPIMQISEMQLGRDAAAQEMQQRILALIPQPASAALDKLIAEAEARGMERCAKIADDHAERFAEATYKTEDGRLQNAAKVYGADEIAAAIRAAKGDQT